MAESRRMALGTKPVKYRNISMPDSMMEAFPPARGPVMPDADLHPTVTAEANPWAKHG